MASKDIRSFFVPRYGSKQPPQSTKSENKLAKKCDASQEAKFKKQKENGCNKKKKRACIIESDSDEDPLPIKLSKHEKKRDQEKVDEIETVNSDSSSKHLKETRPTNSKTNRTSQKQDPSKLKPISVDDFFGDVPVKRLPKKCISSKPKVEYSVEQKEPSKEIHDDEDFKCTLKQLDEEKLDKQCKVKEPSRRISPRKIEKSEANKTSPNKDPSRRANSRKPEANKTSPNKDPSRRASPRKIEKPEANKTSPNKNPSRRASPRKIEKPEANKTSSSLAGKLSSRVKGEEKYSPSKKKCHSHFNTLVHRTPSVEIEEEEEDVKSSPSKRKSETPSKEVNGTAVSTSHKNQVSHIPKKSPSKSSVEINKSRQFKSPKKEGSENSPTQEKTPEEKKREKILNYKRFREREGPRALGSKLIPEGEDGCFSGLTFVSTGVLESLERDQVKELIEKYGGKLTQSVSKKTSYLLIGRDAGPAKLEKAENLGTKQINEDEFLELIKTLPGQKTSKSPVKHSRTPVKSSLKDTSRNLELAGNPEMRKRKSEEHYRPPDQPCKKYKQEETVDKIKGEDHKMWVDKHKPTSTKQIIGQQGEKSNVKKLMKWLMNWYKNHSSGKKPPPPSRWGGAGDDGSFFKAALLSGPPGIGKTTSAQLVCQEAGFQYVELNASDTRSKKNLDEEISQLLSNKSLGNYFSGTGKVSSHHVVIMDEVDGMAGNEDRGGIQELIALIKSTKIPIICICNDRSHPKMRSLVNYCFDLRFQKPRVEQLKGAMMSIAYKEGLKVEPEAINDIIVSSNQDIRQVLHNMSLWSCKEKKLGVEQTKSDTGKGTKDIKLGPFEALRRIFSAEETKNMNIHDKSNLFFQDYSLVPLFVQENYLQVKPLGAKGDIKKHLHLVSETANSLCDGDLIEKLIRREGNWSLLPVEAIFASVIPGDLMKGFLTQMISFPSWLGKNSSRNKMDRLLQELQTHMRVRVSANKMGVNLDYLDSLKDSLTRPLIEKETEGVREVLNVLEFYCLLKEDVENVMELSTWSGQKDPMSKVSPKVKAAFTRTYNKEGIKTPYAVTQTKKSKRGAVKMDSDLLTEENDDQMVKDEGESEDNDDDVTSDAMVKVKKHNKQGTKEDKPSTSKGKGRGKTTGRGRGREK